MTRTPLPTTKLGEIAVALARRLTSDDDPWRVRHDDDYAPMIESPQTGLQLALSRKRNLPARLYVTAWVRTHELADGSPLSVAGRFDMSVDEWADAALVAYDARREHFLAEAARADHVLAVRRSQNDTAKLLLGRLVREAGGASPKFASHGEMSGAATALWDDAQYERKTGPAFPDTAVYGRVSVEHHDLDGRASVSLVLHGLTPYQAMLLLRAGQDMKVPQAALLPEETPLDL